MNTIVIGNGKSLIGLGLGPLVDSYDRIVRFNEFKTEGFEADVGTRTDIHVVNAVYAKRPPYRADRVIMAMPKSAQPDLVRFTSKGFTVLGREIGIALIDQMKISGQHSMMPSAGMMFIGWALMRGEGPLTYANFDHCAGGHYWPEDKAIPDVHRWKNERRWFESKIRDGLLYRFEDLPRPSSPEPDATDRGDGPVAKAGCSAAGNLERRGGCVSELK